MSPLQQKLEIEQETAPLTTPRTNNHASTRFAKRFERQRLTSSPPIFVWIIGIAALFGLVQIYANEKKDESLAAGMVRNIPFMGSNDDDDGRPIPDSNAFSFSRIKSPYEQIWVNLRLPHWAMKQPGYRHFDREVLPSERICFVHVGKAGGSSVGCSLGFSLHCTNSSGPMEGLLPQRTTRIFHADTYDCHDDSAFFLFVVRDPVKRIQSDFLYERPPNEWILKAKFPEYYQRRKEFYLDCPFHTMEDVVHYGLKKDSSASTECKQRAYNNLWGTGHFACHHYFNYQFHLEGLPRNARILVIRNEHLVNDWNNVEHFIGGVKEIIPSNHTLSRQNVNHNPQADHDKSLTPESQAIICKELCNEIVSYKKILKLALNLSPSDIRETMEELRKQCPEMADKEEGDCRMPMPDIKDKLLNNRGYRYVVDGGMYKYQTQKLEMQVNNKKEEVGPRNPKDLSDAAISADLEDDDDYQLPYSTP